MQNYYIDKKDEMVMKLIHYFVTKEDYRPIIVNGVQNEIWLENLDRDISIIRININYIHNNEQLMLDQRKVNVIRKSLKKKTYSLKLNVLNIMINARDEVEVSDEKDITTIKIDTISDMKKNKFINEYFPEFKNNVQSKKVDVENMIAMSEELNSKTQREDKVLTKIFTKNEKPIMTYILLAINVIVYILTMLDYSSVMKTFANNYIDVQNGEFYRLITCAFLHANEFHIFFNMYALYNIGKEIERFYGKAKYLFIYLGSALIGSLFSCVLTNSYSVGASGAVFGLFGAMVYFGYKYRAMLDGFLRSGIVPIILINLFLSFIPGFNIDAACHIGGLVGGLLFSYTFGVAGKSEKKDRINGIIITCILVAFLIYMLLQK